MNRIIFTGSSWQFLSCRPDEAAECGTESQSCKDMCQSFIYGIHIWPVQTHSDILNKSWVKLFSSNWKRCSSCQRAFPWVWNVRWHSSPVFAQAQLSAQELKDVGAVLFVLVCRIGRTNRGHGHDRTRRAGARYQHRQPRLHHHVHPLKQETEWKRGGGNPSGLQYWQHE